MLGASTALLIHRMPPINNSIRKKYLAISLVGVRTIRTLDYSYPRGPIPFVPYVDYSYPSLFVPWTVRTLDCSYLGLFVP